MLEAASGAATIMDHLQDHYAASVAPRVSAHIGELALCRWGQQYVISRLFQAVAVLSQCRVSYVLVVLAKNSLTDVALLGCLRSGGLSMLIKAVGEAATAVLLRLVETVVIQVGAHTCRWPACSSQAEPSSNHTCVTRTCGLRLLLLTHG